MPLRIQYIWKHIRAGRTTEHAPFGRREFSAIRAALEISPREYSIEIAPGPIPLQESVTAMKLEQYFQTASSS